jgi:hypothetical protein
MPEVKRRRISKEQLIEWQVEISDRHRLWGYDLPAFDLDFMMIEYDLCKCVAIIEYKNEHADPFNSDSANCRAMIHLSRHREGDLPAFCVRYASDFSWFEVTALNQAGEAWFSPPATISEGEYRNFLYRIRRRNPPVVPFDGSKPVTHR